MKRIQLLPNVVTAFSLTCGLFVIFKITLTSPPVDEQVLSTTAGILLLSVLADIIDGTIARAMHVESLFGSLFDSLADAITFGVGPSVIVLKTFSLETNTLPAYFLTAIAMVYTICGVLRLIRFTITSQYVKEDNDLIGSQKKDFIGLPIPAAAAAIVSANLLLISKDFKEMFHFQDFTRFWILILCMLGLGYLMISRFRFLSLKNLQIKVASFPLVAVTVCFAVLLFWGITQEFPFVFFLLSWGYIALSFILMLIDRTRWFNNSSFNSKK